MHKWKAMPLAHPLHKQTKDFSTVDMQNLPSSLKG